MLRAGCGNKEGKGMLRTGYGPSVKKVFNSTPCCNKFYKSIIKMSLDLMEFILETICLKQ